MYLIIHVHYSYTNFSFLLLTYYTGQKMIAFYEVSIEVMKEHSHAWLDWMITIHIPEVMKCGVFINAKLSKVTAPESESYDTFHIQYSAKSLQVIQLYRSEYPPALQASHNHIFGEYTKGMRKVLQLEKEFC
jgi:Domain of unknown function (DUF4286)